MSKIYTIHVSKRWLATVTWLSFYIQGRYERKRKETLKILFRLEKGGIFDNKKKKNISIMFLSII